MSAITTLTHYPQITQTIGFLHKTIDTWQCIYKTLLVEERKTHLIQSENKRKTDQINGTLSSKQLALSTKIEAMLDDSVLKNVDKFIL